MSTPKIVDLHGNPVNLGDAPTVDEKGNAIIPTNPTHFVYGVQIWEVGHCSGVALYSKMSDARAVRDILNKKYAELKVDHEAKITPYPVY